MTRTFGTLAAMALVAAACDDGAGAPSTTSQAPTTIEATPTTTPVTSTTLPDVVTGSLRAPRQLPAFAAFTGVPLLDDSTPFTGPATPRSLDDVQMTDTNREWLQRATELRAMIEANGFAVQRTDYYRFFHSAYEGAAANYGTVYVATDAAYNLWHLAFAKVLRDTEEQRLEPALAELLAGLVAAARAQQAAIGSGPFAEAATRVVAYYEAAATLLGLDVGSIDPRAAEAVTLATDASKLTTSPITGYRECRAPRSFVGCVDYTQFLPRGHYTRSETLGRYFRAMSMLGQEAFYVDDVDSLRIGILAARPVVSDPNLLALWKEVYEPTAFLVGVADDYTPDELEQAAQGVSSGGLADLSAFATDAAVLQVGDRLLADRPVGIDPENASVRVVGARLVLDSFILDQLAWPNVGTEMDRRVYVSPLDLASTWGSPLAQELQRESGQHEFLHYETQLAAMREVVAGRTTEQWAGTVYDAWLYALEPQFAPKGAAFPDYMRSPAWAAKSLQTGLGSYTELKHDTILYSKQGTAGEGEGPPPPPYEPHHWVEPDPVAFGRIAAVAALTRDGLAARGLLDERSATLLDEVVEVARWVQGIAADELAGTVTSAADNDRLRDFGRELEVLWFEASDIDLSSGVSPVPSHDDAASLVADIFRSSFEFLELGVGAIDTIWVIVPDGRGGFQLASGGVYSYYEFWRPAAALRLTDEEWRSLLADGRQPPRPAWQSAFLVGGDLATVPRVVQDVG
jgi:hypothetical protein